MKIAIIGTTAQSLLGFRGDMIKVLVEKGYEVYAFCIDYTDTYRNKVKGIGAIPVDYHLSRTGINAIKDMQNTYWLYKKLKDIRVDVCFSYFSKPAIFGSLAAYFAQTPKIVAMLEGLGYSFTEQPEGIRFKTKIIKKIQVLLYKIAFKHIHALIVLNHDDKKDLLQLKCIEKSKIIVLGGIGLNMESYKKSPAPTSPISFIFVGRFLKEKGINEFISAAKIIKAKYNEVEFNILGNIDPENPGSLTKIELDRLIMDGDFNFPGFVDNVAEWISKSSVFVLPSYREGFPRSTQEAMAIGRAIITTNVPGCKDTVNDGLNGFIVDRWSSIALANSMEKFVLDKNLISQMGDESFRIAVEHFDTKIVTEKVINILKL
ncbi:glycosyltransferase family 4 protein [Citrobacter freundii]|nr:glycosyltransferase family 4 protein [Citrobacter freundii]